jgi:hypothetical protein
VPPEERKMGQSKTVVLVRARERERDSDVEVFNFIEMLIVWSRVISYLHLYPIFHKYFFHFVIAQCIVILRHCPSLFF